MRLERPVIVIVPCFDGIYKFPTRVSKYILDVYSEVYGLDLYNPEDIIFISGHKVLSLELETTPTRSRGTKRVTERHIDHHIFNSKELFTKPKGPCYIAVKADYIISDNTEHIKRATDYKKALEEAYRQSVTDYMERHYGSHGIHSPIAPYVNDLVSKQHCLTCSETFESDDYRLVWLFDWSECRSNDPDTEK